MQGSFARIIRNDAGFTFVEILAAMVFLAILIPVVIGALAISNRAGVMAERSAVAMQLAENRLNELLVDGTWVTGATGGDFGQEWPGYRWEMTNTTWPEDTMSELSVTVHFQVQGREQNVRLTTIASEDAASATVETPTTPTP